MAGFATQKELDDIARRVARQPVFSAFGDCSQAYADRRVLMDHLMALEAAGMNALNTLGLGPVDLDAARQAIADEQDRHAERPDDWGPGWELGGES